MNKILGAWQNWSLPAAYGPKFLWEMDPLNACALSLWPEKPTCNWTSELAAFISLNLPETHVIYRSMQSARGRAIFGDSKSSDRR